MRYAMNPFRVNKKTARENNPNQTPGIIVLCNDSYSTPPNSQKRKNGDQFGPTFKPGKYGQISHKCSFCCRVESTRQYRKKGGPREYAHTHHMGLHKDKWKKTSVT
jgi:hypothetical protein